MRVIDFFCGAGGFSEGFSLAGFDVIWAVDNWQPAVKTHKKNHPISHTICDDVLRIASLPDDEFEQTVPDSEIIIGSPPCVAFSNSNKSGKAEKDLGKKLILAYLRIIARKLWKANSVLQYWILENVPNSEQYILDAYSAEDLGLPGTKVLKVKGQASRVYLAQMFGVPSKRERYFCGNFPEPSATNGINNTIPLKYVLNRLGKPGQKLSEEVIDPNFKFKVSRKNITDHHYYQFIPEYQWTKAKQLKQDKGYMGRMSFPENLENPSRTIMATMTFSARESMILGCGDNKFRAPTIREVASLMSFPIDYRFYGDSINTKYRLVGNAVPPKLALAFAKAILEKGGNQILEEYIPKKFDDNDFTNLNFIEIPIPTEKNKVNSARFRYHIPYLKLDQYRVELSNHESDFIEHSYYWDVKIQYSQGINAKTYLIIPKPEWIPAKVLQNLQEKILMLQERIGSYNYLQEVYCLTSIERKENNLLGPLELLQVTRSILDQIDIGDSEIMTVNSDKGNLQIPLKIIIGYYFLWKLFSNLEG